MALQSILRRRCTSTRKPRWYFLVCACQAE